MDEPEPIPMGLVGRIAAYERPESMSIEDFLAATPEELGDPAAEADNIAVNAFYVALFSVMGNTVTTTGLLTAAALALGTSAPGTPGRTNTGLTGSEARKVSLSSVVANPADPPSVVLSYFSPAADGALAILECGLCTSATLGAGQYITHSAFSYNRPGATDIRYDYTLSRSLT